MADTVSLIPKVGELSIRVGKAGEVVNFRLRVTLESPPFDMDLGGRELARDVAQRYATDLKQKFSRGLDAQGRALKAISEETRQRRERRRRQREDASGAKSERFRTRGRGTATSYLPRDPVTPMHESGLFAGGLTVTHLGTRTGDPIFGIAFPLGGGSRMSMDDGRGARFFALAHYGVNELIDIPNDMGAELDRRLNDHLDLVMNTGRRIVRLFRDVAEAAEDIGSIADDGE